ncbi:hypothetical protein [Streptomyces sp. I05A-00742]|uniref:hypothetical protein n=1 Tax=Streptomyces sp. I05A-00742 TaxID=2732853 RepID=UPI0014882E00|nr:hypothetical protein [Streptomyces sp. I05A-00742]
MPEGESQPGRRAPVRGAARRGRRIRAERVVVLGAGLAGLLAAYAVSEWVGEVVLVDSDDLVAEAGGRPGAPQSAQLHALLAKGLDEVGDRFPGLTGELTAAGAVRCHVGIDAVAAIDGHFRAPVLGETVLGLTRPLLEGRIRRRVLALPHVGLVRGRVVALSSTAGRVDGAVITPTGAAGEASRAAAERFAADLVVDATGRSSRLGHWLAAAGHPPPPTRRVHIDLGYATLAFHRSPGQLVDGVVAVHSQRTAAGGGAGAAVLVPVEGRRWMAAVAGYAQDRPGRELDGFLERCRADPARPLRTLARHCRPAGPVLTYRVPDSVRRDFHRLGDFPAGLVAVGDAVAAFNPVYAQGMTCAALHARILADWLRSGPDLTVAAWPFFRRLRRVVDNAWRVSVVEDLRLPHAHGPRPRGCALTHRFTARVNTAGVTDARVQRAFFDVVNMRKGPAHLMRPDLFWRAMRAPRPGGR